MTLVWRPAASRPPGPRTHAFVIGVGHYRHMPGGAGPAAVKPVLRVKQVDTPPLSASAIVDFLVADYDHPVAPLGSVEMLVSQRPGPAVVQGVQVGEATMAEVRSAFTAWKDRCDEHPGNVAIFYFCGHGVAADNQYLLLDDFAADRGRPMANSIDLNVFHLGMDTCQARTQLFLIDACRERNFGLDLRHGSRGDPLVDPDPASRGGREAPILYAAGEKQKAFGAPNQVTRFTAAVLAAFRGAAATEEPAGSGTWVVRFNRFSGQVSQLLAAAAGPPQSSRASEAGDHLMSVLPGPPLVPLEVIFDPVTIGDFADLRLDPHPPAAACFQRPPTPGPSWLVGVPAATYNLAAAFPARPDLASPVLQIEVFPPRKQSRLGVLR